MKILPKIWLREQIHIWIKKKQNQNIKTTKEYTIFFFAITFDNNNKKTTALELTAVALSQSVAHYRETAR